MFAALNNVQSLVSALPPAKDFAPLGKNQLPVKEVQIEPKQVVQADVNNDGSLETLLVSLIHPTYGDPAWDNYPNGRISLALFSAEGSLIWSTASTLPQYVAKLSVDAQPVDLSPQETGILFRQSVTMQDSGDNRNGQATLYRWNGNSLASVWQWETQAEGQGGAGISQGFQDTIQLEDINHDGIQEILVQRSLFSLDLSQPSDAVNARVDLPGALVFQWKGQTYVPAYYQNGDLLTPIRPWPLIGFAAHVTKPIQVDGDPTDWQQLEYFRGPPLAISSAQPPMSLGARVAWDDQKMYITGQAAPGQVVTVGLDTGLAIDFTDTTINKDNIVLQVFIPGDASCSGTTSISISSSTRDTSGFAAAAQLSNSPGNCNYELSIPLQAIDLNPAALVSSPGWMQGSPSPTQARLYHPNAGQAIGFAIAVDGHGSTPTFQVDDPTTWATLIFIADR